MNPINHRISDCIKVLGITKTEFAERLNISQPFVSQLTNGSSLPSDRTVADICREFNVSEVWLRTGEGDMLIRLPEDAEFDLMMTQIQESDDSWFCLLGILYQSHRCPLSGQGALEHVPHAPMHPHPLVISEA